MTNCIIFSFEWKLSMEIGLRIKINDSWCAVKIQVCLMGSMVLRAAFIVYQTKQNTEIEWKTSKLTQTEHF